MEHQVIITAGQFEELKRKQNPIRKVISFRKFWKRDIDQIAKDKDQEWRDGILKMEALSLMGGRAFFYFWAWEILVRSDGSLALYGLRFESLPVFDDLMSIRKDQAPQLIIIGKHEINKVVEKVTNRRKLEADMWNAKEGKG